MKFENLQLNSAQISESDWLANTVTTVNTMLSVLEHWAALGHIFLFLILQKNTKMAASSAKPHGLLMCFHWIYHQVDMAAAVVLHLPLKRQQASVKVAGSCCHLFSLQWETNNINNEQLRPIRHILSAKMQHLVFPPGTDKFCSITTHMDHEQLCVDLPLISCMKSGMNAKQVQTCPLRVGEM